MVQQTTVCFNLKWSNIRDDFQLFCFAIAIIHRLPVRQLVIANGHVAIRTIRIWKECARRVPNLNRRLFVLIWSWIGVSFVHNLCSPMCFQFFSLAWLSVNMSDGRVIQRGKLDANLCKHSHCCSSFDTIWNEKCDATNTKERGRVKKHGFLAMERFTRIILALNAIIS